MGRAPFEDFAPREGFRLGRGIDGSYILEASVSAERLLGVFLEAIAQLGDYGIVVVEDANLSGGLEIEESLSDEMENWKIRSSIVDFEDVILHDGRVGVTVFEKSLGDEVRVDSHKTLRVLTEEPSRYLRVLSRFSIEFDPSLELVSERAHSHSVPARGADRLLELKHRLHVRRDVWIGEEE
jgi:hypothetical protein